ncbi:MAG: BamA/TamA family outer membrane protein [Thainema sp.]
MDQITMRLSPVLVAILSAAATAGFASSVNGQTVPPTGIGQTTSSVFDLAQDVPETPPQLDPEIEAEPVEDDPEVELEDLNDDNDEVDVDVQLERDTFPVDDENDELELEIEAEETDGADDEVDINLDETIDEEADDVELGPSRDEPLFPDLDDTPAPAPALPDTPDTGEAETEPRVLISEVDVVSTRTEPLDPQLEAEVYSVIQTQAGQTTTRSRLQEDINAIFSTGFFSNVQAIPEDTPLGVRVTFAVQPNPVLTQVQFENAQVLPEEVVQEAFSDQYGQILNLRDLQRGIQTVNEWYQENGYVLAQVTDAPEIADDGTVTFVVAEGVIEDIRVRFIDEDGNDTDEDGEPIDGRTRDFIITREFRSESGDVFNQAQIQQDLQNVFGLGIFDDVRLSLEPGEDPRQVDVVVNVVEGQTGSLAAGVGFSTSGDLFGTVSYQEQNLGGNNQKLGAEFQLSTREILFDVSFTDPWIAGAPYRTSYTVNAFNRRSVSLIFDGGDPEVGVIDTDDDDDDDDNDLFDIDRPRIDRLGGGVSFRRPYDNGWTASLGAQYQHVTIRDGDGDVVAVDELGNDLSLSGTGEDDLWLIQFGAVRDLRDNVTKPTSGSLLRLGSEQAFPLGAGSAFYNRLRASYSYYTPVEFIDLFEEGPEVLAFNIQGGTILGDFPPYEAFSLGGSSSVRGYDEGDVGSGQSFVQATVEYRFPIFSIVDGALFADFATDLGTGEDVIGNPAGVRGKPGSGFGYGVGVRVESPLGPIRIDYGFNDEGESRIHFGVGERF